MEKVPASPTAVGIKGNVLTLSHQASVLVRNIHLSEGQFPYLHDKYLKLDSQDKLAVLLYLTGWGASGQSEVVHFVTSICQNASTLDLSLSSFLKAIAVRHILDQDAMLNCYNKAGNCLHFDVPQLWDYHILSKLVPFQDFTKVSRQLSSLTIKRARKDSLVFCLETILGVVGLQHLPLFCSSTNPGDFTTLCVRNGTLP